MSFQTSPMSCAPACGGHHTFTVTHTVPMGRRS
jgi:hypothetical protein